MPYFKIEFDCGCGTNEEYLEFSSQEAADKYAYQQAIDDYESFEGLHGVRSMAEIAEDDFGIEDWYDNDALNLGDIDAVQTAYIEERESVIHYYAEEISEEEYKEALEE
jgi:hypothetical protein